MAKIPLDIGAKSSVIVLEVLLEGRRDIRIMLGFRKKTLGITK
jgi:hypothetical protein